MTASDRKSIQTGARKARSATGIAARLIPAAMTIIGRRGRQRRLAKPPAICPSPMAAEESPQVRAPSYTSRATMGPSTWIGPSIAKRKSDAPATITQSHVWLVNSRQPAPRSPRKPRRPPGSEVAGGEAAAEAAADSSPAKARPGAVATSEERPRKADGRSRHRNHALTR